MIDILFAVLSFRDVSDANRDPYLRNTTTAFLVLASFFVFLRFLARWKQGLAYGADDWTVVAALVSFVAAGGLQYAMIRSGLGRHAASLSSHDLTMFLKLLFTLEFVYCTAIGLTKISLLLMYSRLFPTRFFTISFYILGGITIGWVIAIMGVSLFQCAPIRKAWLPMIEGTCINLKASFIGNAIPNICTDIVILCLPIREVMRLQISSIKRASLIFMFGLGFFTVFASVYRFTTIMGFQPEDITWTLATPNTWCLAEVATGIISVCLPTLRPLFMLVSKRFNDSRHSRVRSTRNPTSGSHSTELVTIGCTGDRRRKQDFNILEDRMITVYPDNDGHSVGRSDSDMSGQLPLHKPA